MEYVFISGSEEIAPNCIAAVGSAPEWSGKSRSELTRMDMDSMLAFCMTQGKRIGYEDFRLGRPVRVNPFHRRYLHGMPHLYFKAFYVIGRKEARQAHDLAAEQIPLLAAA